MQSKCLHSPHGWLLSLLIASTISLVGCEQNQNFELQGAAQGTTYHIKIASAPKTIDKKALHQSIENKLADLDRKLSNYRDDSEISLLNQKQTAEWLEVSPEIAEMLAIAKHVFTRSQGCYDLSIKPLLDVWGFSKHDNHVPSATAIAEAKQHIGMQSLEIDTATHKIRKLDPLLSIDLSSIAQGYSVQALANYLEQQGIHNYLVEIGGEMKVKGSKKDQKPWRVAVQNPALASNDIHKILQLQETKGIAIMTAGTYRNFFEENGKGYSHIIDPRTGQPVSHRLLSVTVLHDDPTWADAWDTALLCLGETAARQLAEAEHLKVLLIYATDNGLAEYMHPDFTQWAMPSDLPEKTQVAH